MALSSSEGNSAPYPGPVTPARVDALVRLLGDEDPKISSVAWSHLERIGAPALPLIEKAAREADDLRVRAQAARFTLEWKRREVFRKWVEFCRSGQLDLEEGAFLIARTEYPEVDIEPYQQTLERYATVMRGRLRAARTTEEAVKKVSQFLFEELGFSGNAADYYNPDNSYLHRVLELKKGIPISLSVIVLLVARRLSIPLHGVSMPQHFLLKYRQAAGEVFLDAFHGGKLLSARECIRFLTEAGIAFREGYLAAVPDRNILKRMLGNLLQVYLAAEDVRRSNRITAMLKLLG